MDQAKTLDVTEIGGMRTFFSEFGKQYFRYLGKVQFSHVRLLHKWKSNNGKLGAFHAHSYANRTKKNGFLSSRFHIIKNVFYSYFIFMQANIEKKILVPSVLMLVASNDCC